MQSGTTAEQVRIEMERVEENMVELQSEIAKTGTMHADAITTSWMMRPPWNSRSC